MLSSRFDGSLLGRGLLGLSRRDLHVLGRCGSGLGSGGGSFFELSTLIGCLRLRIGSLSLQLRRFDLRIVRGDIGLLAFRSRSVVLSLRLFDVRFQLGLRGLRRFDVGLSDCLRRLHRLLALLAFDLRLSFLLKRGLLATFGRVELGDFLFSFHFDRFGLVRFGDLGLLPFDIQLRFGCRRLVGLLPCRLGGIGTFHPAVVRQREFLSLLGRLIRLHQQLRVADAQRVDRRAHQQMHEQADRERPLQTFHNRAASQPRGEHEHHDQQRGPTELSGQMIHSRQRRLFSRREASHHPRECESSAG